MRQITVVTESDLRHPRIGVDHTGAVMSFMIAIDTCELESSFRFVCCVAPEGKWANAAHISNFFNNAQF